MRPLARAMWFCAHALLSCGALVFYAVARRGRAVVFRHAADVDADGLDRQMGPLVDALRARGDAPIEVVLAPLDRRFARELARIRRAFFSHAALLGPARAWAAARGFERTRVRVALARLVLRAWRPRCVYLIDESGSGQTWLRAARALAIPTFGIQHGDFQPWNPQYVAQSAARRDVEPADVLCVWSPWFRARLERVSRIYSAHNVVVTGRMRYPRPEAAAAAEILVVADGTPGFGAEVAPFLRALEEAPDLDYRVAAHPASPGGTDGTGCTDGTGGTGGTGGPEGWRPEKRSRASLSAAVSGARLVVGVRSSALLEALDAGCAVLVLRPPGTRDTYADEQIFPVCDAPEALPEQCRALLREVARGDSPPARGAVWGGAPPDAVAAILAIGAEAAQPARSHGPTEA